MREVERLLRGRRPRRRFTRLFRPLPDEDADLLRLGIELRARQEGADEPAEEFVAGLRKKIATAQSARPAKGPRRRNVLAGASIAAASAAAAVTVNNVVRDGDAAASGVWHRVLPGHALPAGAVRAFQAGAVAGFVTRRADGRLSAVSGSCTHLGCRLALSGDAARLDCPCHNTAFAVTGEVVRQQLPIVLPPLPRYRVRESGGHIEVFLPL